MSRVTKHTISGWTLVLIISLILFIFFFSFLYYNNEKQRILNAKYRELSIAAKLKEKNIFRWQQQQISNIKSYSLNPLFVEAVRKYIKCNPEYLKKQLIQQFRILKELKEYDNIMLTRVDGTVEISVDPKMHELESEAHHQLQQVLKQKKASFGHVFKSSILNDHLYLDMMAPVKDETESVIAILVVRLDPFREITLRCETDSTMQNNPYTYVVEKSQSSFSILKDSLLLPIQTCSKFFAALTGNVENFYGYNVNNQPVIGHIQYLKGSDLYMVSEIKYQDIVKSFHRHAILILLINFLIIAGLLITIIFAFQYKQKNIYRSLLNIEMAFREELERFRITLYSIGDGVITTDELGFITNMNSIAAKYTGWDEAEAQGKQINEVFHVIDEKTRIEISPSDETLSKSAVNDPDNAEILISRNGEEYYISEKKTLVKDLEGKILGSVLVFQDQTSQRRSEKALRLSDARLRKAERIANIGHWELHLSSNMMYLSDSMKTIFGLSSTLINYDQLSKLIMDDYLESRSEALKTLISDHDSYDIEFKIKRPSDNCIIDIHSIAEYDISRNIVFGIIRDVTEFRLIQKKLLQSNEELKNLNSMKDRIFSIIAHDLRNPVGNILNLSEFTLNMPFNLNDKKEKFIELINTTSKNLMYLLENLLYWARMKNNQLGFYPQKLFLKEIVDEVVDLFESSARLKQIEIKNHVLRNVVLTADSNMLKTILRNLISNAVKFTNPKGLIEIMVDQYPVYSLITVKDNGVGMNEKKIKNLFRADAIETTAGTANEKGSGLGLIICKEFLEKHQGKIWAKSKEGAGSSFCFTLKNH